MSAVGFAGVAIKLKVLNNKNYNGYIILLWNKAHANLVLKPLL